MSAPSNKPDGFKTLATNRGAFHDYHIIEKFEAGLALQGAEVKSIKEGHVSLNEAFADIENGQAVLHSLHVQPYAKARADQHDPIRPKRLLLHRAEIHRLVGQTAVKGHTLIPLRIYSKRGLIKVELGLARGKHLGDKRETLRRKTVDREISREIAGRTRRARD
jgi:SsrA-binding protein